MIRALLGGSFDPVHIGHTAMVGHVLAAELAAVVHIVPAWLSPHKQYSAASAEHRLQMVRLAFPAATGVVIDSREVDAGRPCFTVDTLAALRTEHGNDRWRLLIGGDNLGTLHTWHRAERLQTMAEIVVFGRNACDVGTAAVESAGLDPGLVNTVAAFDQPVSSTGVRAMLATGTMTQATLETGGIPAPVARYILAHRLYRSERNGSSSVPDSD